MRTTGKKHTRYDIIAEQDEHTGEKRRNFALVGGGIVCVAILVVYLVVAAYPSRLFSEERSLSAADKQPVAAPVRAEVPNSPLKTEAEDLFASTTRIMQQQFAKMGKTYTAPSLQLFEDTITAYECGPVLPATGAFYCPANKQVFIDLSFFKAVNAADSSSASRTQAYIVAHQVGHHIEDLLGITARLEAARNTVTGAQFKQLNTKAELLADYYAGVWAHYAFKKGFDNGDAEIAVNDITKINTTLAQNTEITLPDPYSYVDLGRRANAFYRGYESGNLKAADIFEAGDLK